MNEKQDESLSLASPSAEPTSSKASKAPITALTESYAADKDTTSVNAGILPSKGDLLDDRFMLVEILGSKGVTITYKAKDENKPLPKKARYVIIKVLKRLFQSTSDCVDALAQAAQKCQNLDHPNIAKVHGFHCNDSTVYLDREYLPGESLEHKIRWGVKRMPAKQAVQIVNEIGRALAYAHELGVVHGDLKPANVFLTASDQVKIIDFSIVHALRRTVKDDVGASHFRLGNYSVVTRSYASPELLDRKQADPRDDVYALACIAYELLAGHHPFGRVRPPGARDHGSELRPSAAFTRSQWSSLQKALAFERDARTPTIEDFLSSFNASTKWAHMESLAAGVVLFCAVVGLFIYNQMSVREGSVDPEMVKSPILSEEGDPNQLVSSSKDVPVQIKAAVEAPTQIEVVTAADVQAEPSSQLAESVAATSMSDVVEPSLAQQSVTAQAESEVDSLADVADEPDNHTAGLAVATSADSDESTPEQPAVTTMSTGNQSKEPVLENDKIMAITEGLPEIIAEKGLPLAADSQSPEVTVQSSKGEISSSADEEVKLQTIENENAIKLAKELTSEPMDSSLIATGNNPTVVINEFMASNGQTVTDADGGYDDWIELYNWSLDTIDLSGYYLSDNPKKLKQWRFPDGTKISATSYLVIWADRASSDTDLKAQPHELHANFELSHRGEQILLVDSDENGNSIIDRISFGRQHEGRSIGRSPNGFGKFGRTHAPTPGWANSILR